MEVESNREMTLPKRSWIGVAMVLSISRAMAEPISAPWPMPRMRSWWSVPEES